MFRFWAVTGISANTRWNNGSGTAALDIVGADGLAGATVDARTARMGEGLSTWSDGVISARNEPAARRGVEVGMTCKAAARRLLLEHP